MKKYYCDRCKGDTAGAGLEMILVPTKWGGLTFHLSEMNANKHNSSDLCKKCILELLQGGVARLKGEE